MLLTVISLLGVLILLVLVHECGHFFTAKATGVRVEEFGLFYPPRLLAVTWRGVRYSLNALPIGGFVKLAGEEDPNVPGSLASQSSWVRILVLAAGSVMNALLPIVLFSAAFMIPHNVAVGEVLIDEVAAGSPAMEAGIVAGDKILAIDNKPVANIGDVQQNIQLNLGQQLDITVLRDDATRETVQLVPRWRPPSSEEGATGIKVSLQNAEVVRESYPFWEAIPMGLNKCVETYILFKNVIIQMIIGSAPTVVAGPVGIAEITGEAARAGFSYLLDFAAFFSINLAIINIFPLPALDGGRIAFVVVEWVRRGKRVSPRIEGIVHTIGFIALIAAMVAITYQDILRVIAGESIIP